MILRLISLSLIMLAVGADDDPPLPTYDIEAACRAKRYNVSFCVAHIQPYYEKLKRDWPVASADRKRQCLDQTLRSSHARYVELWNCLELKRRIEEQRRDRV